MKKLFLLMIGACLYADDETIVESLEKQEVEVVAEGIDFLEVNAGALVVNEGALDQARLAVEYAREALARAEAALEQAKEVKSKVVFIAVKPGAEFESANETQEELVAEAENETVATSEEVVPEEVAPIAEAVDELQPVAEVETQEVLYLLGDQLVLNTGLVLELEEHDYLELFDVGDALLVKESEVGYSVVHSLTGVEVLCDLFGQVEGKVHFVGKVMNGMVELSNGDLYLTEDDQEGFWTIKTSVLKVVTQDGDMLIDLASGDSQRVAFLGNLEVLRTLDFIAGSKGHQMEFVTAGNVRWISSDLGNCAYWGEGDEVIVQKFNSVSIASFDPQAPLMLLHNVTRDEFAIAISLAK